MDAHIVHDWHDYQLLERPIPAARFPPLSYMTLQLEGMQSSTNFSLDANTSDTVSNVLLDWCSNPEAVSCFVTTGLKGKNTFDQFMVSFPFFILN